MRLFSRWRSSAVVLLLPFLTAGPASPAEPSPLRLASGPPGGMYQQVAEGIPPIDGSPIEAVPTNGSVQNLTYLLGREVDFAFAQQDVVSEHFRDHPQTELRVVGRLFFDYLHIFLRDSVDIETASDLARLRIFVGEEGSGTHVTAARFLDTLGISSMGDNVLMRCDAPRATRGGSCVETGMPAAQQALPQWFEQNRLDAAMRVTTPGTRTVCDWMESRRLRLLPLDPRTLRSLTLEEATDFRRQSAIGTIPSKTYENQENPVPTIAVPVLLVTRVGQSPERASHLLESARAGWARIASERDEADCAIPLDLPRAAPLSVSGLEPLEGLSFEPSRWVQLSTLAGPWLLPALFLLFLLAGWRFRWHSRLHGLWREDRLPVLLVLLLAASILLITAITYLVERSINENFSTLTESFWSITVYLFSGLEDRTPYTNTGRVVATLGLLLGPAFFAVLSGWLARFFMKRERRMPQNLRDHYLLLNWNERAAEVVRELHHPLVRERNGVSVVVVLTDDDTLNVQQIRKAGSGWDPAFEDFYLSIGDPTDERALLNANAQDARTILVLADKEGDERTIRSILMLRKIARELNLKELHVVAELLNPANTTVLDELAKDFPGLLERISGLQVRTCLLAQAALTKGVVGFYSDLLQVSRESNEVYACPVPDAALGMDFREYASLVLLASTQEPLIPVGLQRLTDGRMKIYTNPVPGQAESILQPEDCLVLIGYQPPRPDALPIPERKTLQAVTA